MIRRIRKHRQRWSGRRHRDGGLSLTSLMDILTCLLFFVLKSFVSGGEAVIPPPGIDLPMSTADQSMSSSLVIAIDNDAIVVAGERIASVAEATAGDQMLIEPLAARLDAARRQIDEIAQLRGGEPAKPSIVTIQGDAEIEFRLLQRVMYTLNHRGFPDVALAVLKKV